MRPMRSSPSARCLGSRWCQASRSSRSSATPSVGCWRCSDTHSPPKHRGRPQESSLGRGVKQIRREYHRVPCRSVARCLNKAPSANLYPVGLSHCGSDGKGLVQPGDLAIAGLEANPRAEEVVGGVHIFPAREARHHLGRTVAIALAHYTHPATALRLDGVVGVDVEHAVAARDLPALAAEHLAAQPRPLEMAAEDVDAPPLAERALAKRDDLAYLRVDRDQVFERRHRRRVAHPRFLLPMVALLISRVDKETNRSGG